MTTKNDSNKNGKTSSRAAVQTARKPASKVNVILGIVAAIAVVAAAVGFWLYSQAGVPTWAAAKVNDTYISEEDVTSYIAQYRASSSLTNDSDFASALTSQGLNISTFRQNAINQLALQKLVDDKANELGIKISDEQIQQQVDAAKQSFAFGDDSTWQQTLLSYNMSEEGLYKQYKTNLQQKAINEKVVVQRDAKDSEVLSYMQNSLAATTQKHAYRLVFTGPDASTRASNALKQLQAMRDAGTLNAETFSAFAKQNSNEENVSQTGGSYAWSGANMADEAKTAIESVAVGQLSEVESIEQDSGALEIFYCDAQYTFPAKDNLTSIPSDIPSTLLDDVKASAKSSVYQTNCSNYLAYLLSQAQITYYPVPANASYNINLYDVQTNG